MENYGGLIEMVFFYSIAIGVGVWQWWKMRRELREMRAEREAKKHDAGSADPVSATAREASDTAA